MNMDIFFEHIECHVMPNIPNINDVRLSSGASQREGRVEVYNGNLEWATVCDEGFGINEAKVICRQLGFSANGATLIHNFGIGSGGTILGGVQCDGSESHIKDCNYTQEYNCSNDQDVGVACKKSGIHRIIQTGTGL